MTRRSRMHSVELADDPDRSVRMRAWMMVRQLKLKKALPVLEARLGRDHLGFAGFTRDVLEATINELEGQESKPQEATSSRRPSAGQDHRRAGKTGCRARGRKADELNESNRRAQAARSGESRLERATRRRLRLGGSP